MLPETADRHRLLRAAAGLLPGDTPRLDAELLLAAALGEERLPMLLGESPTSPEARAAFERMLGRRMAHEPVAYIIGQREFWSLPFLVTRDVLIPRPESETLIEAALAHFATRAPRTILDLGTGSGALLLAALSEWPAATGLGIDRSAAALAVARRNAARLGLAGRASFRSGDWLAGLPGRYDLVLCNPPYVEAGRELAADIVRYEPPEALFAGVDGLDAYRRLLPGLARLLCPDGVALFEFGADQQQPLLTLAASCALSGGIVHDLAGRPRVLCIAAGRAQRADHLSEMAQNPLGKQEGSA